MPGSVSDSFVPGFGTRSNAKDVREALERVCRKLTRIIGPKELRDIVTVAQSRKHGLHWDVVLSEKELRLLRFALNRALESL